MLEKVAIHQTRLRVPGVGLDARGVCLGKRGLVLLPSLERLVAFLAIYTNEVALTRVLGSLSIQLVRSALGAREVALSCEALSSDVMDRIAEVARLTSGFTFTGTTRHFVQYRDASAPFGYDAPELLISDEELCLYHTSFAQAYALERELDLRQLVLRLGVHPEASARLEPLPAWLLAAPALGAPLARHLAHSGIAAEVGVVGLGSQKSDERWLFRLPAVPERLSGLLTNTPGLTLFYQRARGAAVRFGFRHPLALAACPVFDEHGIVLFQSGERPPVSIEKLPVLASVEDLVLPGVSRLEDEPRPLQPLGIEAVRLSTELSLLPTAHDRRRVSALRLRGRDTVHLRRLSYVLGAEALRSLSLASTDQGVFLLERGVTPWVLLGDLYSELGSGLFVPMGYDLVPRVDPARVLEAMGTPKGHLVFFHVDGRCHSLPESAFVPLAEALLEPHVWSEPHPDVFERGLDDELPRLRLEPLGLRPLKGTGGVP